MLTNQTSFTSTFVKPRRFEEDNVFQMILLLLGFSQMPSSFLLKERVTAFILRPAALL